MQTNVSELKLFSHFLVFPPFMDFSPLFLVLEPTQGDIWIQGNPSSLFVGSVLNGDTA